MCGPFQLDACKNNNFHPAPFFFTAILNLKQKALVKLAYWGHIK